MGDVEKEYKKKKKQVSNVVNNVGDSISDVGRNINAEANRAGGEVERFTDQELDFTLDARSLDNAINNFSQGVSWGYVGYEGDGKFNGGELTKEGTKVLDQVTGKAALKAQIEGQERMVAQAEEDANKDRMDFLYRQWVNDIQGSISAEAYLGGNRDYLGI